MKSKLVYLDRFSGAKASVYSVMEQDGYSGISVLIHGFISSYKTDYLQEVLDIGRRLKSIFKENEGLGVTDRVCALYDVPAKYLRLYCIRLTDKIVIVGGGGPKTTRTWQEDPVLRREVSAMMHASEIVRAKLMNGSLRISATGLRLEGDFFISRI